jgi:monofunctional biosynthetic peptidoglycan transglycosylase
LLAAVLPNPRVLHIERPSAYLRSRQEWILGQMRQLGGPAYLQEIEANGAPARGR